MAHALESVAECSVLRAHPSLEGSVSGYFYKIERKGDQSVYSVSKGTETFQVNLDWAFGDGATGQTYLFQRDGHWFESRVSYFTEKQGFDLTMGAQQSAAATLDEAAGRRMTDFDAGECFSCHATHAVEGTTLTLSQLTAGVQCERCHQGAEQHAKAAASGDAVHAGMPRLSSLSLEETSNFCGQCHRTWADIAAHGPRGILNVRFQPYRLAGSNCYTSDDSRLRCTACHNPHRPLETSADGYSARCVSCHSPAASPPTKASTHICQVSKKDCAVCHMPLTCSPKTVRN